MPLACRTVGGQEECREVQERGAEYCAPMSNVSDLRERKGLGMDAFEEVQTLTPERVSQPAGVGSILHLFCEKISWIGFATDMRDRNGPVVNPFTSDVLSQLNVMIAF